jgi:uncharacterized protein
VTATRPGPTALRERALGPDLARGTMLLFIALANSHYFLRGATVRGGFPQDTGGVDRVVTWAIATFVDGRAFPMFGLLFGYGVAHIVGRQTGSAWATRLLLWRRCLVLVVVGLGDALLFYVGDILAAYGVLLFLGVWAIHWRDRWLWGVAALSFVLGALPSDGSMSTASDPPDGSMLPTDLLGQFADRVPAALFVAVLGPLGFVCPFLFGLWAGRRRLLEEPQRHRRLLTTIAVVGVGAAVLGAQPVALVLARVIDTPDVAVLHRIGPLHDATGVLGGFGYAATAALLSLWLAPCAGRVTIALAAAGQRSLTCYLCQSVVWAVVFTPYLLDLSGTLTVTTTALLALGTWAATVALADRLRRWGHRGPFEVLTRRVTYGRRDARRTGRRPGRPRGATRRATRTNPHPASSAPRPPAPPARPTAPARRRSA